MDIQNQFNTYNKIKNDILFNTVSQLWENGYTPNLTCKTDGVTGLPENFYSEKFITLNVSNEAINNFTKDDNYVYFQTRFNGKVCDLIIEIKSIMQILALDGKEIFMVLDLFTMLGITEKLSKFVISDFEKDIVPSEPVKEVSKKNNVSYLKRIK